MMKKKKQSRSQSSTKKTLEPSSDSSPSPRLLSIIRSKLASGKDLKHMFRVRGMRSKPVPGLSSQSRIVRCPECHKLLQEPLDATSYKCGGCDSILHAKRLELEGNDNTNTIPKALLSSQNHSLSTEVESAEGGSRTPVRSVQREYNSRASPSVERGYHSETVNKHETSDIHREWMRRADEFSVTGDSDAFASARSSPYNSRSSTSQWKQHEGRYEDPPRVPFYPGSPSPSSAYEYGYSSPFHGSHVSASEQSYNHHQPNQFKQYGREGSFQESSVASPTRFPGETSTGKYYPRSSQSQHHDLQYHNLYESSNSTTPIRPVYSESSYQAAAAPNRSTYSKHSVGISKSDTSSKKSSRRDKKRYVRERNPVVKHHILPSAGGAPFATCSYCLELLQLPQVSPQGKHKRYQVRCGSCSGILKFSLRGKTDTVQDSPSFLDSGMGFADETVTNHQDSASEGHEEIYPDGSYLPCLDDDYGDIICKSTDAVILNRSQDTLEDKGIKEDIKNISSIFLDSKLEALQPHLKPLANHRLRKQQPASSDTIAETSRNHVEQSQEAHSEKSTEMDNNIIERVSCNLEESEYENNEHIKPEEVVGEGSGESLEVPEYKNERMSETREQAERDAERSISHCKELLYKKEYVYETCVLSEDTRDTHEIEWEETQENEECGDEHTWEENMGDKPWMHLGTSQYIGDSINDSSLRYSETFEDTSLKKDIEDISNIYSDPMSTTPQSPLKSLVNENQRFIGHPAQLCEAIVTISRIHEEQSKHRYENLKERQELEMTISDRVRCELEESREKINETLELNKVGEDGSIVSLEKASGAGEEGLVSHQMESPNENLETSYGTLETVYLEGSGFAGERTWEETVEDRAGLHLEEYESNYENYSIPFCTHDYELGTILEPDKDPDGRSESNSQSSFNENGGSEERVVLHDSQDAITEHSQYEYESSSKMSNTVFDVVRSDLQELKYETNETLGPNKMVRDGSVVSVSQEEEPWLVDENKTEALKDGVMVKDGPSLHLEKCENESIKVEETLEWTSERAPTFRLHESELGAILEFDDDADDRSHNSSRSSFNDHELSKERQLFNVEEPQLVIDGRTEPLQVGEMAKDTISLELEECENESMKVDETFEWTPGRTLTFRRHECEVGTKHEPDADDIFRLSLDGTLEQERRVLMSQDKQENAWNTFKKCDADEDIPAFSSRVSSEDYKSPSKMAELDSEGEEEISRAHLEHFQKENEKSRLTSEPYAHIYSRTEPSEIVGLRLALYQTQKSPLRSPLTSPIHTPIGSPLHYLMASQIRSPITSIINSRIVSPLRSPINSSGSLSDVLFLSKKR
ncbi:PREDICTED: uncharacterized protein LOC104781542 [Camelina sativa]|uniref:Uncharacterized protein LOC104781542 n=1 Tax=Camelina sativa TaxID=90675 RepID=A0ABM0YQT7_CAMSA|nr:PREDICTED: uncharacterized protein LOC104781542 [Camelina sativa]